MSADNANAEAELPQAPPPRSIVYCDICSFPPEYCEFSSSSSKCRSWLESAHPDLHSKLYSAEAVTAAMSQLTAKQAEDLEKEAVKKERKAKAKEEKAEKEMKSSKIVLRKESRTKKKATTSISGLHLFQPPLPALKVVAKGLASKLATGASVGKAPSNPQLEEIVIQGDVADEVRDLILSRSKPFETLKSEEEGGPGEKNVVIEEEKKKKPAAEGEEGATTGGKTGGKGGK